MNIKTGRVQYKAVEFLVKLSLASNQFLKGEALRIFRARKNFRYKFTIITVIHTDLLEL